jgi:hypothetical protein
MGGGGEQMTALVVQAEAPLDNRIMRGKHHLGLVRILVAATPAPILVANRFKLDRDHWPVVGMQLPVTIELGNPGGFEVRWDEVASIEARVAASDKTLADPLGTRKSVFDELTASGAAPPMGQYPEDPQLSALAAQVYDAQMGDGSGTVANFEQSIENARAESAPEGRIRAVVLIAASEATLRQADSGDGTSYGYYRDRHGKKATVLAVNVPGQAPYAVFDPKFDHREGKGAAPGAGLPAAVSASDPTDVEILWDEMLSVKDFGRQATAAAMQATQAQLAAFQQGAASVPPHGSAPGPAASPQTPALPPEMKKMMAANAKQALAFIKDPAMRKTMIAQYRAAGIEVDED